MPGISAVRSVCFNLVLVFVCSVLVSAGAYAQGFSGLLHQGDEAFAQRDYRKAIESYQAALNQKPDHTGARYRLGLSLLQNKQPDKAKPHLVRVNDKTKKYNPELQFMLGQSYHFTHGFDSASVFYRAFRDQLKRSDYENQERVEKLLAECRVGAQLVENPVRVKLENLGPNVNSPHGDFVPVMTQDERTLIFTSRRQGTTGGRMGPDGEPLEDVYLSTKEKGAWTPARNLGTPINTDRHDACVALSPDGSKLYVYKDTNGGDIYVSEKKGNSWSAPVSLGPEINSPHYEPSLCVSADGDYVFFSSNRPGGYGGLDLFVSVKQPDGTWGEAMNLGAVINTPFDEDAPYLHSSGNTLYFSSRGQKTMGGHDIFRSEMSGLTWLAPVNLGYPINTAYDDINYIVPAENRHAYYATTRPNNYGRQDIYQVIFPVDVASDSMLVNLDEPVFVEPDAPVTAANPPESGNAQQVELRGRVLDATTKKPLRATITLSGKAATATVMSDSLTGEFSARWPKSDQVLLTVRKPGYLYFTRTTQSDAGSANFLPLADINLTSIKVGASLVLQNVYFETGKATIKPEAFAELGRLQAWLSENNNLKIEISGHTDNTGRAETNRQLSEQRAKAVADYLISKGIEPERITAKGYGSDQPIAPNTTEEGRRKNRRTEFRIVEK